MQRSPTDRTEAEWTGLMPLIPATKAGGRPRTTERRAVVHAIFSRLRSGCQGRLLPTDFPPRQTVSHSCWTWRRAGVWERRHDTRRGDLREATGRTRAPSVGILDSQTVQTTEKGGSGVMTGGNAEVTARATSWSMSWVPSWS